MVRDKIKIKVKIINYIQGVQNIIQNHKGPNMYQLVQISNNISQLQIRLVQQIQKDGINS